MVMLPRRTGKTLVLPTVLERESGRRIAYGTRREVDPNDGRG
jgi:hypothetical protein